MWTHSKITTRPVPLPIPRHIDVLKSPSPWWKEQKAKQELVRVEREIQEQIDGMEALIRSVRDQASEDYDAEPERFSKPGPVWVKLILLGALLCLLAALLPLVIGN